MKRLFEYVKPYWKLALIAPLLMVLEVTMDLLQPRFIQRIIDIGIAGQNIEFVFRTGLSMLGIAFIGLLGGAGNTVFAVMTSQKAGADIRSDLFAKIQDYSFESIDESSTGNLITILTNDVEVFMRMILMLLRILVRAPLMAAGSLVMAYYTSPRLSMIIIPFLPVVVVCLLVVNHKVYPLFSKVQEKMDDVNSVVQESLAGMRVVKAFVRDDFENRRFCKTNEEYMHNNMAARRLIALLMPVVMLTVNLGVVAVIWFGGLDVIAGDLQVGQVVACINYLLRLLFSMAMAGMMIIRLSRAAVSADRIAGVFDVETADEDERTPALIPSERMEGRIEYLDVGFSYTGKKDDLVLSDLNFTVKPGETVGIMGETGSGKTTLVRLIPRLYAATEGEVLIDDINVDDYDRHWLRKHIGFILQETILFTGSIRENICYGNPDAGEDEIIESARIAQAHQFITELPEGYDTKIQQRGVNLSGGQKQRMAIARALVTNPSILIFDDSTSAVDIKTEYQIMQALRETIENATVLIIAQKISSVTSADRILLLEGGQVIAEGSHAQLMRSSTTYQEIYESQYGEGEQQYA